jgi:hypothetical protein
VDDQRQLSMRRVSAEAATRLHRLWTFTTATARLAIDELLQGLSGFRGQTGRAWQRVRRFDLMQDRRPGAIQDACCPICSEAHYWGRGDVKPPCGFPYVRPSRMVGIEARLLGSGPGGAPMGTHH